MLWVALASRPSWRVRVARACGLLTILITWTREPRGTIRECPLLWVGHFNLGNGTGLNAYTLSIWRWQVTVNPGVARCR